MDWRRPINALIPGLEGHALQGLYFIEGPQTVGEIHQRAKVGSYSGYRVALARLAGEGLVNARKVGNAYQFTLNTRHVAYPALKSALDTFDPYGDLRTRLAELVEKTWPTDATRPSLSIYGSVAQRTATAESDLDLLLIIRDEDDGTSYCDALTDELDTRPEEWTGNRVHLYTTTRSRLRYKDEIEDPIVSSWLQTADTVAGPTVAHIIKAARS